MKTAIVAIIAQKSDNVKYRFRRRLRRPAVAGLLITGDYSRTLRRKTKSDNKQNETTPMRLPNMGETSKPTKAENQPARKKNIKK